MKKILIVLSVSLFLVSCGPSDCDCHEYYSQGALNHFSNTISKMEDCNNKYRDQIPKSYKGTSLFNLEARKLAKEGCGE